MVTIAGQTLERAEHVARRDRANELRRILRLEIVVIKRFEGRTLGC